MSLVQTDLNSENKSVATYSSETDNEAQQSQTASKKKGLLSKKEQADRIEQKLAALRAEIAEEERRERDRNAGRVLKLLKESGLAYIDLEIWNQNLPKIRTLIET